VDYAFLESQGVKEGQFPLYVPPTGESAGFHRCNISRALAKGLKFRPVEETGRVTLEWYKTLPAAIQAGVAPQFAKAGSGESWLEREKTVLETWRKR
jgi:2'-hydroxyisoflavone reductase